MAQGIGYARAPARRFAAQLGGRVAPMAGGRGLARTSHPRQRGVSGPRGLGAIATAVFVARHGGEPHEPIHCRRQAPCDVTRDTVSTGRERGADPDPGHTRSERPGLRCAVGGRSRRGSMATGASAQSDAADRLAARAPDSTREFVGRAGVCPRIDHRLRRRGHRGGL